MDEADGVAAHALLHHVLQAHKGAAADEQDLTGVDLNAVLVGMLAAPLGGHVGHGALQHLQQGLLHALARYIAGDRGVLALAGDLVDLVDVDDAPLGLLHIHVGLLQQPQQDVFHVLAHIAGFRERGGVGHGEGHLQHLGQGLGQQGLAAAGGADQQDVALVQAGGRLGGFTLAIALPGQALVVVVHRHGEGLLGLVLAHHLAVEEGLDRLGFGDLGQGWRRLGGLLGRCFAATGLRRMATRTMAVAVHQFLVEDLVAEVDALVADVHPWAGDQFAHLVLGLAAEGTLQVGIELGHRRSGPERRSGSGEQGGRRA